MDVAIKILPALRVAYLRHTGPYGEGQIGATWDRLNVLCAQYGWNPPRRVMLGISLDNPQCTPPEACRYDACVAIDAASEVTGELGVQAVPGGLYACAAFQGRGEAVGAVFGYLGGEWLAHSGHVWDDTRPCFELYPAEGPCMLAPGLFVCEVCIPIAPRTE